MKFKNRYLQLTDTIMFEYKMLGGENMSNASTIDDSEVDSDQLLYIYHAKLKDGHLALVSPVSSECEYDASNGVYKKQYNPRSLNTFNHLVIPKDSKDSLFYYFSDPDYKYVDDALFDGDLSNSPKINEYLKYLPDGIVAEPLNANIRFDKVRLYFVNGYDFSNMYGFYARISVDAVKDGEDIVVDLCNFMVTRDNGYKLIKYMESPILMGNDIYDKYIEVSIPCLYDIAENGFGDGTSNLFEINDANPIIRLMFSVVDKADRVEENVKYTIDEINANADVIKDPVNVTFARTSTTKGSIPTTNVASDNLGCYIAEMRDYPYIEFYGTWNDEPLDKETVWKFNTKIKLYNRDLIRQNSGYEVEDGYKAGRSESKWIVMHEIVLSFLYGETVIKKETYRMDQIFISDSDPVKFYYRPMIFDDRAGLYVDNIHAVYTMRLINADDKVQFVKTATLSLVGDMGRFFAKSTNLNFSQITPYTIYNKIVETKGNQLPQPTIKQKTKYVNVFYDTTTVSIVDGENLRGSYNYTLQVSQAPKSYKFVFKKNDQDGKMTYMDLTNGYYKIMFRDSGGNQNLIEPTYSKNMNLYLGELEFNFNMDTINKLRDVPEGDRKMSIVVQNENNMVSSMFDLLYTL